MEGVVVDVDRGKKRACDALLSGDHVLRAGGAAGGGVPPSFGSS